MYIALKKTKKPELIVLYIDFFTVCSESEGCLAVKAKRSIRRFSERSKRYNLWPMRAAGDALNTAGVPRRLRLTLCR